jgi:hypothetical protein
VPRRSKDFVENELNEIFKLIVVGTSDSEIKKIRKLPDRTYFQYRERLSDRLQQVNLNQKSEQILFHKEITRERLLKDKQVFQQVMSDERSTGRTKVEAARADLEANIVLFKLENETAMFVNTIRKQQADILRLDTIATNISSSGEASTTTAS